MDRLSHNDILYLFLALGILLGVARLFGELAVKLGQPSVLGEMMAGVLLGPTVLGRIAPELGDFFMPDKGGRAFATDGFLSLAVALFLLVAGLEVDLSTIWRQGKSALAISFSGLVVPAALGFGAGWAWPDLMGKEHDADRLIFALFFATALSITALPVIAKTLMDLNLYRTDMGMMVIAAATFDDITGWLVFSVILGMATPTPGGGSAIWRTVLLTLLFAGLLLTVGRIMIHRALPWVQAHTRWPGGVIAFVVTLALLGGAATEWIGIKAIFGAFLVGVAIGDSSHLREHTRSMIDQFISSIFAPIFFATIGMRVDFVKHFDPAMCAAVLLIACLGKTVGCGLGAQWSGISRREAWAIGFSMNARGVMEIIFGLMALQHGIIGEPMFVALTVMALVTSMMAGPAVQRVLKKKRQPKLADFLKAKAFVRPLKSASRADAIAEMCESLCAATGLEAAPIKAAVLEREEMMSTGLGNAVAVPHARIEGLAAPSVGVGISPVGIDFDSPDGKPAHLIFLILTPTEDNSAQVTILSEIAKTYKGAKTRERALASGNHTEFLAAARGAEGE